MEVSEVEVIEDMDVSDLNKASDLEIQYRSTPQCDKEFLTVYILHFTEKVNFWCSAEMLQSSEINISFKYIYIF